MNKEIWKNAIENDTRYQVSNMGRFRSSIATKKDYTVIKGSVDSKGYRQVYMRINGKTRSFLLSRLVAQLFIPNPENKPEVNHINGIKKDNRVENLEWATRSENCQHAYDAGLNDPESRRGENSVRSKLKKEEVLEIRSAYSLKCFTLVELADAYDVSFATIGRIINYKTWKHI